MFSDEDTQRLRGATAHSSEGHRIGTVGDVYLDDETGQPTWATVNTGLFGTRTTFVPLDGATLDADILVLPYAKDVVADAPQVDVDEHLSEQQEADLRAYYSVQGNDGYLDAPVAAQVGELPREDRPAGDFIDEADLDSTRRDVDGAVPAAADDPAGRVGADGSAGRVGARNERRVETTESRPPVE